LLASVVEQLRNIKKFPANPQLHFSKLPLNLSTPQKSHLNLTSENIFPQYFLGKNTLETARILAEMFAIRFGVSFGTREEILRHLLPKGRAGTWGIWIDTSIFFAGGF
jgi:hypothetical protein